MRPEELDGGLGRRTAWCRSCERSWLVADPERVCPYCARAELQPQPAVIRPEPPEQVVPFQLDDAALREALHSHVRSTWFKVPGLALDTLMANATRVYWPRWMVDATLDGAWEAEAGFHYQVQSNVEKYDGSWTTEEVVDTRTRWEIRHGRLRRRYDNALAPAISGEGELVQRVGTFDVAPRPFEHLDGDLQLPDLRQRDSWDHAFVSLRHLAADECREAAHADEIRSFRVDVECEDEQWTLQLLPLWTTWYEDLDGVRHPLLVNGQSGITWGPVFASHRKGWGCAAVILTFAAGMGLTALGILLVGIVLLPLLTVGGVLGVLSLVLATFGFVPPIAVWIHNRGERALSPIPE